MADHIVTDHQPRVHLSEQEKAERRASKVKVDHQLRIHIIVGLYATVVNEQCGTPIKDVEIGPIVFNLRNPITALECETTIGTNRSYTIGQIGTLNASGLFVLSPVMKFPGGAYMLDHFVDALNDADVAWTHST